MLESLCSKSFKLAFSSTWTKNLQMYKLGLEKEEEAEIKLPTFTGPQRKQSNSRKTTTSASLTTLKAFDYVGHDKLWKILRDGNTRPPYLSPKKHVCRSRRRHGINDWFKIGKGVPQGCILSPCLFNLYAEYIMWNAGLDKAQAGIKIVRRNINNLRYTNDTTLMAESEEELKILLMKVKEDSEKSWLKTQLKKLRSWNLVPSLHGK